MSAIFRKKDRGIEVHAIDDGAPTLLAMAMRVVDDHRVDIMQWMHLNNAGPISCWWAIRNPVLRLLNNLDSSDLFGLDGDDEEEESQVVRFEGATLLHIPNLVHKDEAYFLDEDGDVLSGSNIFGSDNQCLGDSYNPLSMEPVDLMLYNKANRDLGWRGGFLEGEYDSQNIFNIHSWPTLSRHFQVPTAISDAIARLWPI